MTEMKEIQSELSAENLVGLVNNKDAVQADSLRGVDSHRSYSEDIIRLSGSEYNLGGMNRSQMANSDKNPAEFERGYPEDLSVSKTTLQPSEVPPQTPSRDSGTSPRTTLWASEVPIRTLSWTLEPPPRAPSGVTEVTPRTLLGSKVGSNSKFQEWKDAGRGELDLRLYDQIGHNEEQKIYAQVCDKYGEECGRRYRLVRSMIAPEKTETVRTTVRSFAQSKTFKGNTSTCERTDDHHPAYVTCPHVSEEVRNKMKTLVDITPMCTTENIQVPKRWKDVLRRPPRSSRKLLHREYTKESQFGRSKSEVIEYSPCYCGMAQCDCHLLKEKCVPPVITKKCDMVNYKVDETNNYLVTCRENLQDELTNDRRVTVLQQHAIKFARRDTRESAYLQSTYEQAENELMTCLMKVMPPQGQEVSQVGADHVQQMASVIGERKMIDNHKWRSWRHAYTKMEHQDSDEVRSLDSDIVSSSSDDDCSVGDVKFSKSVQQSRIPYFKETFHLANTLFDKIETKMEKCIFKNHDVEKMRMRRFVSYQLRDKIKLLQESSGLFKQIMTLFRPKTFNRKRLTPFSELKQRKRVKANNRRKELKRKQDLRKLIEGSQLGRKYRRPKRSILFTKQENYRGFSPYKQKILQKTSPGRFRDCNLVANRSSRRALTNRIFHNDYRLIRELFDDPTEASLWDPGMKARLEEYLGAFRETDDHADENEEPLEDPLLMRRGTMERQRQPKKDEQKTQTALPNSWSYCSRSSGNAPEAFATLVRSLRSDSRLPADIATTDEKLSERERRDRTQRAATSMVTIVSSGQYPESEQPFLESSSLSRHAKIQKAMSLAKSTTTNTTTHLLRSLKT